MDYLLDLAEVSHFLVDREEELSEEGAVLSESGNIESPEEFVAHWVLLSVLVEVDLEPVMKVLLGSEWIVVLV